MRATVYKKMDFAAAHMLPNYKGKCANLHGHTWQIEVGISGEIHGITGMVVDFVQVKRLLEPIIDRHFDHHYLNDTVANPTAENIAGFVYKELCDCPLFTDEGLTLSEVTVWESEDSKVTVRG